MLRQVCETKRKRYSPEFKAQIVLEILKKEKYFTELSYKHGIHVNQLRKWRTQFIEQMPQLFQKQNKDQEKLKADYEEQVENLYAEVGLLTTQLSWINLFILKCISFKVIDPVNRGINSILSDPLNLILDNT